MTTQDFAPVLPALTDRVASIDFGRRNVVSPSATTGDRITVIQNAQFEGLPGPKSVHLFRGSASLATDWGLPYVGGDDVGPACEARAVVQYSSGTSTVEFSCDWRGQFSIVCSALRIDLLNWPTAALEAVGAAVSAIRYGAHVGVGDVSSSFPATHTSMWTTIGPSSVSMTRVPSCAERWYPVIGRPGADHRPILESDLSAFKVRFSTQFGVDYAIHRLSPKVIREGLWLPPEASSVWIDGGLSIGSYQLRHRFALAF